MARAFSPFDPEVGFIPGVSDPRAMKVEVIVWVTGLYDQRLTYSGHNSTVVYDLDGAQNGLDTWRLRDNAMETIKAGLDEIDKEEKARNEQNLAETTSSPELDDQLPATPGVTPVQPDDIFN